MSAVDGSAGGMSSDYLWTIAVAGLLTTAGYLAVRRAPAALVYLGAFAAVFVEANTRYFHRTDPALLLFAALPVVCYGGWFAMGEPGQKPATAAWRLRGMAAGLLGAGVGLVVLTLASMAPFLGPIVRWIIGLQNVVFAWAGPDSPVPSKLRLFPAWFASMFDLILFWLTALPFAAMLRPSRSTS